jgi:hypothetical protein
VTEDLQAVFVGPVVEDSAYEKNVSVLDRLSVEEVMRYGILISTKFCASANYRTFQCEFL